MEAKKSSKANLESQKGIFFEIGLIIALACLFLAFEWKAYVKVEEAFITVAEEQAEEEIIPITQQMMKPPPPPPPAPRLTDLIDIVDDNIAIDEALDIEDVESDAPNRESTKYSNYGENYGDNEYSDEAEIFVVVEDMPRFPGGDINKWLKKNVKYPMIAQENNIQGRVFVQFVIERDGRVTDVKVARPVDPSLDKEAIRVIQSMPKWTPGKQRGKPVRVSYTVPINFQLQ